MEALSKEVVATYSHFELLILRGLSLNFSILDQ